MEQTKICSECGQEKPLSEFNKKRSNPDGRQERCRACFSRYNKIRYQSDPERFKRGVRKYREENLENVFATRMEMCERNPSRKNASMAVDLAVKLGHLEKPDHCLGCGKPSSESRVTAHHHDYTKPLEVVWVCSTCHRHLDACRRIREGKSPYGVGEAVEMLDGEKVICTFPSIAEAARSVGTKVSNISQCLGGKSKSCAGFGWRYKEVDDAQAEDG